MRFGALALSSSKANSKERKEGIKKRGVFTVDSENTNTAVISYENPISKTFKKNEIYRSVQFKGYTDSDGYLLQHFGPSQENLVAHYPLGYTTKDESGFGYHGTVGGNPTMGCEGVNGVSTSFDGTDDYITNNDLIGTASTFFGKYAWTVSFWLKGDTDSSSGTERVIQMGSYTGIFDWKHSSTSFIRSWSVLRNSSWYKAKYSTNLVANTWYHITGTFDGTNLKAYLNGVLEKTTNVGGTLDNPNTEFYIGSHEGISNYFNGKIDEVRIYNKALSYQEISELYHLTKCKKYFEPLENSNILRDNSKLLPPSKYLKGFWKLNNNLRDLAGGGTNGTFPNGSPNYKDGVFGKCIHFKSASSHYVNIASAVSHIYSVSCFINVKSGTNNPIIYLNSNQYISIDSNRSILFTNNSGNTVQIYINGSLAVTKPGGGNVTNYKSVTDKAVTFEKDDKSITIKEADWTNRPEPDDIIYIENAATAINNGYKTVDYSTNTKIITDFTFTDGSDDVVDITIGRIDYNKWYHIVVTSESPITTDNPFYIGRQGSNYFDGKIEEVRLYRKLLTHNEVRGLFHQRISGKNLIGHWKLDETNGITAKDSSTYNNHGTMNGPKCGFLAPTGLSRYFDGSNDLIKINDGNNISSKLNESNSITIASWIKPTYPNNTTTHNRTLFSTAVGYYGDLSLYVPDYDNTQNKIKLQHSQAYETNEQIIRPNETGWLHVAATSENGLQSIYLNGIKPNAAGTINFNYDWSHEYMGVRPVGHWKLDETSGTTISDSSGNGYNGTVSNSNSSGFNMDVAGYNGKAGGAIDFDGTDDFILISEKFRTPYFTVAFWAYAVDDGDSGGTGWAASISNRYTDGSNNKYGWNFYTPGSQGSEGKWSLTIGDGSNDWPAIETSSTVSYNVWHHVVGTYDGTTLKFYIDNKLIGINTTSYGYSLSGNHFSGTVIGKNDHSSSFYTGKIDDVRIYDTALSAEQIKNIYNQQPSKIVPGPSSSSATWIIIVQDVKLNLELTSSINGRIINLQEMIAYDAADAGGTTIDDTDYDSLSQLSSSYPTSKLFDGNSSGMYHSGGGSEGQDTQWIWGKYNSRPKSIKINNRSSSYTVWNHRINFAKVYLTHTEPNINKSSTNDVHNHTSSWTLLYTFPGTGTVSGAATNRVVGSVQPQNNTFSTTINIPDPDGTDSVTTNFPTQIGRHRHYQNDCYMGYLSDLRLYDVALTPPEIRELFYHRNNGLMINGPEDFPIHEKNSSELPDPVAHYRMDERSGTTIRDSSGNGNHGTSSGIAASSFLAKGHDGRIGSAVGFDGSDDYIQVANDTDLTLNGNLTLSVWFTTDVTSSWNETIVSKGVRKEFDLMIYHNTSSTSESRFRFHQGNSAENGYVHYDSITQISNGIWYNLIVTREGSGTSWTIKFYLNGRLITTKTSPDYASGGTNTPAKTTNVIRISRRGDDYSESAYFDGKLDDVRIYNTALTAEQVRRIYNNSNDLLAHYRISDKKHQIAPDSSINKLDAKYTNFPTNPLMSTALTGSVPLFNGKEQSLKINKEIRGIKGISFWAKPCNVSNLGIMRLNTDQYIKFNETGSLNIVGVPVTDYSVYLDGAQQTNRGYGFYGNSSGSLSIGNWTNSVISITNSKYSLHTNENHTFIGRANNASSYQGYLEDVRFYGSSLTQAQAISLYKMRGSNAERKEPVGHWTMNEITGDGKLKDISIEANHGTINSGPSFATDRHGNPQGALDFDGTDDYINFSGFPSNIPIGSSHFTISFWAYPDIHNGVATSSGGFVAWGNLTPGSTSQANAIRLNGTNQIKHYFWSNDLDVTTGSLAGAWHNIIVTYDGTTRKIYVDNVLKGSDTPSTPNVQPVSGSFTIGKAYSNEYFDGKLDDVRIYNTALSSIEIKNIYNQGRPNTGPIAHWSLDEKRGSLAVDSVNNFAATISGPNLRTTGYDGTINGAMDFDGSNDYLEVKSKINEIQAMSFWMKPDDTTSRGIIQLSQSKYIKLSDKSTLNIVGIPNQYLSLYVDGQTSLLNQTNSLSTLNVSQWQHGVISISNDANSISTEYGYNYIGRVGSSYYDGCLDEIKFFNYPLSLGQARDLYNDSSAKILDNLGNQNSSFTHIQKDKRGVELGPPEFVPARDSLLVHLKCDETSGTSLKDNATQLLPKDKRTIIKPVGHWTMDESSGTSITDSSSNGNTGTKTADGDLNVTGYNGKKNGAVDFDGSGDYIEIPYSTDLDVSSKNKLTLSVWVKPNVSSWSDDYRCILRYGNPSTSAEETYRLMVSNSGKFYYYDTPTTNYAVSPTTLSTSGRWYHIVAVLDGRKIKLYIDGKLNQTATQKGALSSITSDYKLRIGKNGNSNTDYWKGKIDDVRIYDVALNKKQVMALYKTRNPLGNEVAYYSLDETSGTTIRDSSGNGYHGTSSGIAGSSFLAKGFNGKVGSAIDFDGTDDYITTSNINTGSGGFGVTNKITVTCWAKSDTENWNQWGMLISKRDSFIMSPVETSKEIRFYVYTSNWAYVGYTPSSITEWAFYTGTYDGTELKLYINGSLVASGWNGAGSQGSNINNDTGQLYVGHDDGLSGRYFDGKLDDVRIYNAALSRDQIRDIYRNKPKKSKNITSRDEIEATFRSGDGHQEISSKTALGHEGIENKALHFDGHSNYISLPNEAQQIKSVSLWAKPNKTNNISILQLNEDSFLHMNPNSRLKMFCNKPTSLNLYVNGTIQGHANFSNTVSTSNRALRPYNWSHIVGTWNNAILGSDIRIGEHNDNYFSGYIEDIKLYDCELNKGEVYALSQDRNVGPVINYTLDEGKGNVLYDTGTLGYNANKSGFSSVYDGWDYDVQLQRNVLKLNGSDEYIHINRDLGEIRTISCWFNTADNTSRNILQLTSSDKLEIDGDKKVSATFASPSTKLYLNSENDTHSSNYNGSTSIKLNTWYFTCVTSSEKIVTNSSLTRIGYDGSSYFSGSLCDIRMYNVELTSKEVKNLYFNSNIYRNTKN